jgi:asparagine synthase (glutamine-hydrolysing)
MCGIVGVLHKRGGRDCSGEVLASMRKVIRHRGPDDEGVFVDGAFGMGHQRLSIIDLSGGHQPMFTADGRLGIVFNGEIYNYKALRSDLQRAGYVFRSNSDTEVLLYLFQEHGEKSVEKLNGIFAFGIWDNKDRRLFLARDHLGVKPLYYFESSTEFVFASEIKSIFASKISSPNLNESAVREYFLFRQVAGERTLFRGVRSLLPGHAMVVGESGSRVLQYWRLGDGSASAKERRTLKDSVEELECLMRDAIKLQMMSDVPLGTFCSGGVDSSLVTALAAEHAHAGLNTFSVGFHESSYDETRYARLVSSKYRTQHHEVRLENEEFARYLPDLIWHNDEPLNFANSVQIFAISRLAREHVTVVLTGEGADELFGGYPRYHIPDLVNRFRLLPDPMGIAIARGTAQIGGRRWQKLMSYLGQPVEEAIRRNAANLAQYWIQRLFPEGTAGVSEYRDEALARTRGRSNVQRTLLLDQECYLVSILNRQDKMSMAASIESRVPILDYRIVEFANRLPDSHRIRYGQNKVVLKRVAERYLPKEVVYRRKSGFGVPLSEWFRANSGLGELARSRVAQEDLGELGASVQLGRILKEHRNGRRDHGEFLWTALSYILWKEAFGVQ